MYSQYNILMSILHMKVPAFVYSNLMSYKLIYCLHIFFRFNRRYSKWSEYWSHTHCITWYPNDFSWGWKSTFNTYCTQLKIYNYWLYFYDYTLWQFWIRYIFLICFHVLHTHNYLLSSHVYCFLIKLISASPAVLRCC